VWGWRVNGQAGPTPILQSQFNTTAAALSPDMRWIAYTSDQSGEENVFVERFPSGGARSVVSVHGGARPTWRRGGREIIYADLSGNIVVAEITDRGTELDVRAPAILFDTRIREGAAQYRYDITADGQRFLIAEPVTPVPAQTITILVNWHQSK
jgi:serine/threonine-protein kinase